MSGLHSNNDHHNDMPEGKEAPPPGVRTMAIVRWVLVAAMALAAVISVASLAGFSLERQGSNAGDTIYYCPMHPQIQQDHPGQCPICGMNLVKAGPKTLPPAAPAPAAAPTGNAAANPAHKYHCPMHPEVTSDDPNARCPKCGMKLEPRPTSAAAAPTKVVAAASDAGVPGLVPINIPSDRVQLIGVRTQKVARGQLGDRLQTVGVVEPDERGLAQISTRFPGWIETLAIAETGAQVRRGQVLATIYSPLVLEAQEELLSALRWSRSDTAAGRPAGPHTLHGNADALVEDARRRLELLGIAPEEIDAIVKARKPQRAIAIRSPVDGHVVARRVTLGMAVQPGTPLYQVADLRTLWVLADIFENDAARVRIGQSASFRVSTYPGESWKGKVAFIYPLLDSGSRTLRVRIALAPQRGKAVALKLRPGMYGDVELELPPSPALTIPSEAVVDTGDLQYVFVDLGNGHFQPRPVRLGRRVGDKIEIQSGLAEGELVVTTANFLLDSESRLRAAIDRSTGTR
jgi:Cu(I)/Ag(I) efflux system membrane fusion protein